MVTPPNDHDLSTNQDIISQDNSYGLSAELVNLLMEALESDNQQALLNLLKPLHAADIANFIALVRGESRAKLVHYIHDIFDAEILVELDQDTKEEIIELLGIDKSAEAIIQLDTDDAINVMEDLSEEDQKDILAAIPEIQRQMLEEGLAYPEDSAGRLLQKNIVTIPEFWNVGQTIDFLRKSKHLQQDFYQIFVVNPKLQPLGSVMLSRMMCAERSVPMKELMQTDLKLIDAKMDQEEVAHIFRRYGLVSAPVVNDEGRMIGLITVDDMVDVIDEEAYEDIMHLGGVAGADFHTGSIETTKRRFPWLIINLATAILASCVIGLFEHNIEQLAALAILMPIVASMGGNAGIQALTVTVRAIATRELSHANLFRVISKEILVGLFNGFLFAILAGLAIYFWFDNLTLSLVFASAIILTLTMAGLAGTSIPLILNRLGIDPAIASSIFLTTVTDIVGFGVFLGLAALLLIPTL